jgi:hypothetical protein
MSGVVKNVGLDIFISIIQRRTSFYNFFFLLNKIKLVNYEDI